MRLLSTLALVSCLAFALHAEEPLDGDADARAAAPKLKAPSNLKFNSTTGTTKVFVSAPAGQVLTADGTGFNTIWAFVKGTTIDSNVSGISPGRAVKVTAAFTKGGESGGQSTGVLCQREDRAIGPAASLAR